MKSIVLLLLLLGTAPGTLAQRMLRGVVANGETGEVLPFANVFLANTTKGTTTSETGNFQLLNLPAGRYDLVVSYVGFETFSFVVQTDTSRFYRILLKPQDNQLATVTVRARRGPDWKRNLQIFRENFIGQNPNAGRCQLRNADVLWFSRDSNAVLTAGAREPLQIENQALGYRLKYQLEQFSLNPNNRYVTYLGFPVFEELTPRNPRERRRWATNRREAYFGSTMHFMRALHQRRVREAGYVLRRITKTSAGAFLSRDTLDYGQFIDTAHSDGQGTRLQFSDFIQVSYLLERQGSGFLASAQTSVIHLVGPFVTIEASGNFYEGLDILFEGYWAGEKTAELLPLDYEPEE